MQELPSGMQHSIEIGPQTVPGQQAPSLMHCKAIQTGTVMPLVVPPVVPVELPPPAPLEAMPPAALPPVEASPPVPFIRSAEPVPHAKRQAPATAKPSQVLRMNA